MKKIFITLLISASLIPVSARDYTLTSPDGTSSRDIAGTSSISVK